MSCLCVGASGACLCGLVCTRWHWPPCKKKSQQKEKKKAPLTSWGNGQAGACWRVGKGTRAHRTLTLRARRPGQVWAGVLGRADECANAHACCIALTLRACRWAFGQAHRVTGIQGRKPRLSGLAMDWSKFWEPAH